MDKYLQYNHFELAEDPSFIRWAKGSDPRDSQDWEAWLVDYPEKAELVAQAKDIVLAMKFVDDNPSTEVESKVWSNISHEISSGVNSTSKQQPKRYTLIRRLSFVAAAAVVLILFLVDFSKDFDTVIETPFAAIENVILPDGSEVMVNAGTKMLYDRKSWDDERVISLEGEAFFSVKKGKKFTVKTQNGSVRVLGTSFNVYNRNNRFDVHCETGKVAVKSAGKETILTPGQSVNVDNRNHIFSDNVSDSDRRSTWKNGIYVYKAAGIFDVKDELERQFDVRISMDPSLSYLKFTGSFDKSNMETALTEVFYPLGLKFKINGKNVTITKKTE